MVRGGGGGGGGGYVRHYLITKGILGCTSSCVLLNFMWDQFSVVCKHNFSTNTLLMGSCYALHLVVTHDL